MVAIMLTEPQDPAAAIKGSGCECKPELSLLFDQIEFESRVDCSSEKMMLLRISSVLNRPVGSGVTVLDWALKRGYTCGAMNLILRGAAVTPSALKTVGLGDLSLDQAQDLLPSVPSNGRSRQLVADWRAVLNDTLEHSHTETEAICSGDGGGRGGGVGAIKLQALEVSVLSHFADVRIIFWAGPSRTPNQPNVVLLAHSSVLCARSDYFRASLSRCGGTFDIHMLPGNGDPTAETMSDVMSFLYSGDVVGGGVGSDSLLTRPFEDVVNLLLAANRFLIFRLQRLCEHVLGRRLNLGDSLQAAIHLLDLIGGENSDLYWFVQDFIFRNRHRIVLHCEVSSGADDTRLRVSQGFHLASLNEVRRRQVELAAATFLESEWSPPRTFDSSVSLKHRRHRQTESAAESAAFAASLDVKDDGGVCVVANEARQMRWSALGFSPLGPASLQALLKHIARPNFPTTSSSYSLARPQGTQTGTRFPSGDPLVVSDDDRREFEAVVDAYRGLSESDEAEASGGEHAEDERLQEWFDTISEWDDHRNRLDDQGGVQAMKLGNERGRFACFLRGGLAGERQLFYTPRFLSEEDALFEHRLKMLELSGVHANTPLASWDLIAAAAEDPNSGTLGTAGQRSLALARFMAAARKGELSTFASSSMLVAQSFEEAFKTELALKSGGGGAEDGNGPPSRSSVAVAPFDVELRAEDGGSVSAHRSVLSARCERFRARFRFMRSTSSFSMASNPSTSISLPSSLTKSLEVPGISTPALSALVHFLYTARLPRNLSREQTPSSLSEPAILVQAPSSLSSEACLNSTAVLLELCFAAEEFLLPQLQSDAANHLITEGYLTPASAPDVLRLTRMLSPNPRLESLRRAAARLVLTRFEATAAETRFPLAAGGVGLGEKDQQDDDDLHPAQLLALALSLYR
jgi:hypothetical protein